MNNSSIIVRQEKLLLLPQRAVFWTKKSILFLSDLHLGKAGHFRKHGIPVSRKVHLADLENLNRLIGDYRPKKILLLGDLFHSYKNLEWLDFLEFLEIHPNIHFILVEGNHDILSKYPDSLEVTQKLVEAPFSFTHIKEEDTYYNISGHIHPGVTVRGIARQGATMPCFLFSDRHAILPAYGQFTGIKKIRPLKNDRVFAIADRQVIELT
ncbi:MAG: ligase-associated DNA damage response endonuclease PdeM [Bacteroidota bacterium]